MESKCRSPICTVVGHVDHGKTTFLDYIRDTAIVNSEPGAITQAIGASLVPLSTLQKICGSFLQLLKLETMIPGILFIDTPGHAAFTNLRKRGGNLADFAIVVVDINEGMKPQTEEAIEILKGYKTPFIIAANKIDLIHGWRSNNKIPIIKNIGEQSEGVQNELDKRLYNLLGKVNEKFGFNLDRFDRVEDFSKQFAIVPCSAKTGEGIQELLVMLIGLTQKYLSTNLHCDLNRPAKGTILEIKEEQGLGCCVDAIIYDGTLKVGDTIVLGTMDEPVVTKVKALFQPDQHAEMRDKKAKFRSVKEASAAIGVRISAPDVNLAMAGMPIVSASADDLEEIRNNMRKELEGIVIKTDKEGIIVKADNMGSLEALIMLLKEKKIPISKATIGEIGKKELGDAESNKNPINKVVVGFNIKKVESDNVKIIVHDVIYQVIDELTSWQAATKKEIEMGEISDLIRPCKIELLKGYVFRESNPAIVGVEVISGTLRTGMRFMKDGVTITTIKGMQVEKENVKEVTRGKQLAASLSNVTVGRQISEGDFLYNAIIESEYRKLKDRQQYLGKDEIETLKEIAEIMRKTNPLWGV